MKKTMTFALLFFLVGLVFFILTAYFGFRLSTGITFNLLCGFIACGIISTLGFFTSYFWIGRQSIF
jgi:hypothetical protein